MNATVLTIYGDDMSFDEPMDVTQEKLELMGSEYLQMDMDGMKIQVHTKYENINRTLSI